MKIGGKLPLWSIRIEWNKKEGLKRSHQKKKKGWMSSAVWDFQKTQIKG